MKLARGFELDPDYVGGGTFALLAKKGAGKSYTARVMAEEFYTAKVPFVLIDPMGTSWGLRSSADGKGEGLPVPIFGGEHGDVPLERGGGAVIADLVVNESLSMILDLSELGSRTAERQFAHDFFERLYRTNRNLVHVLLDEADLFAPQKPQAGDRALLGVTENIVRRGRNRGIGITLITQRPAVLNKDVLTQVDGLVVLRTIGLTDRQAIDRWVEGHGDPEAAAEVMPTLSGLENGESWWWVPELGILKRVKVRKSRTFDSSPTRKRTTKARHLTLADVDLGAITERMASAIERAKAEDPKELRKRIALLEREIGRLVDELLEAQQTKERVEVKVPVLEEPIATKIRAAIAAGEKLVEVMGGQLERAEKLVGDAPPVSHRRDTPPVRPRPHNPGNGSARPSAPSPPADIGGDANGGLKRAERKILSVLLQFDAGRTKTQLALLAGYSATSGGFNNALGTLRRLGLISPAGSDPIQAMEAGYEAIPRPEPAPTGAEAFSFWLSKLKKAEREILSALIEQGPLTKEQIGEVTGYSTSSGGFNNALGKLRTLELISPARVEPISLSEVFA